MVDVLRAWDGRPGQCYYLPSGTLHALGAGLVVAEVQTPSDVTYRAYDWNRVGLDGRPRTLHIEESLQNTRYDVTEDMILQPRSTVSGLLTTAERLAACGAFALDLVRLARGFAADIPAGRMAIWIVLAGAGRLERGAHECHFAKGDVVLIPADCADTHVELGHDCEWIEVTIPAAKT